MLHRLDQTHFCALVARFSAWNAYSTCLENVRAERPAAHHRLTGETQRERRRFTAASQLMPGRRSGAGEFF